jgi:fucose 4-O-acetylase-like acetyltransferase
VSQAPRLAWIDALKGIGIALVACGHHPALWAYSEALGRAIFSVSMPLFFFITGLTLQHGMSGRALAARALSNVIPYLFISLVSVPLIFQLHPDVALADLALGVLYGTGHTIYTVPLWFLPCLAAALVLVFLLDRIELMLVGTSPSRRLVTQLVLFALLQLAWQLALSSDYQIARQIGWGEPLTTGAPWSAEVAMVGASYIIMGRLFTEQLGPTRWLSESQWRWALVIGAVFIAMNWFVRPEVDLNWRYDRPPGMSTVIALMGIVATVAMAVSIQNRQAMAVLRWLGTSTILILWLHATLEKAAFKLMAPLVGELTALVISLLLALAIPAVIATVLKRFPPVYNFIAPNPWLKKLLANKPVGANKLPQVRTE